MASRSSSTPFALSSLLSVGFATCSRAWSSIISSISPLIAPRAEATKSRVFEQSSSESSARSIAWTCPAIRFTRLRRLVCSHVPISHTTPGTLAAGMDIPTVSSIHKKRRH
eukprot:gene10832-12618_t